MIVIIDYELGNAGSILNMFKRVGAEAMISANPSDIVHADGVVLPGVGAFDQGMANLLRLGFVPVLREMVLTRKVPFLGICLGMQLMTGSSEEGVLPGLGWVKGRTVRFRHDPDINLKVPHMGWNHVVSRSGNILFAGLDIEARFYFVHSYHVVCEEPADILSITQYGNEFVSALQHENIFGVQFHPEKSHKYGMRLLKNFSELT